MKKFILLYFLIIVLVLYSNCGKESTLEPSYLDGIDMKNKEFKLYSKDEGIYPDKSVLEDPNNIFADKYISEDFKWKIASLGSEYAATKFYLWATILAREPWGEPQYYVGAALEELAGLQNSSVLTQQAIRAYQAVLDNWPYDKTDAGQGNFASVGVWAVEHIEALGGTPQGYRVVTDANGDKYLVKF